MVLAKTRKKTVIQTFLQCTVAVLRMDKIHICIWHMKIHINVCIHIIFDVIHAHTCWEENTPWNQSRVRKLKKDTKSNKKWNKLMYKCKLIWGTLPILKTVPKVIKRMRKCWKIYRDYQFFKKDKYPKQIFDWCTWIKIF